MPDPNTTTPAPDGDTVERVARALDEAGRCLWDGPFWNAEHFDDRRTSAERREAYRDDLRRQARAALTAAREPVTQDDREVCEHCPDGHSDPTTRPWAAFVASERDGDGQPTHLHVAPTAGQHVAESDAQWVRDLLNAARPSVPTVTALPPSRSLHGQGANEPWHFEHRPPTVTATEVREAARVLYEQAAADDWSGWENEPDEVQRTWIARVHDSAVALGIGVLP